MNDNFDEEFEDEFEEELEFEETWEKIEPLLKDYLKTYQESLITQIREILTNAYFYDSDVEEFIQNVGFLIQGKTLTSEGWNNVQSLLTHVYEIAEYDEYFVDLKMDTLTLENQIVGFVSYNIFRFEDHLNDINTYIFFIQD